MTQPAVFFDDGKGRLGPLRDLRPIFACRVGALTTVERWSAQFDLAVAAWFVPEELENVARVTATVPVNTMEGVSGRVMLINGRCPVAPADVVSLAAGSVLIEAATGDLIAAHVDASDAEAILRNEEPTLKESAVGGLYLMSKPWHARTFRDRAIDADLQPLMTDLQRLIEPPAGVTLIGEAPPRVAESAKIYPSVIINSESGRVFIDEDAVIRPGAILTGPCYIGRGSTVLEQAHIKANTAIGPVCKIAGEVGGTVIQGYTNKAHDGHLGDSWLGEWVNLGAGTTNSNLLNTYGEVTAVAVPGASREKTGETFFGCVLGDHVKTAIGTQIMTGTVAHTGAMWADPAPMSGCIDRFTWASSKGHRAFRMDKFEEVMRAAMGRRKVEPSGAYVERVRSLSTG